MLQKVHFRPVRPLLTRAMSSQLSPVRVAIVGSGPAGFYTAKYLLDKDADVHVDILEKMPVPYGLVRYGVAPDHPEVKSVQETFAKVASNPRFRFFGNVELEAEEDEATSGSDWTKSRDDNGDSQVPEDNPPKANLITINELKAHYKGGVVLACGAENDRKLGLKHEDDLQEVLSARSFVNWYNGHPDFKWVGDKIDLSAVKDVVIIGQGNVAIDCARILTKSVSDLAQTDLADYALEALKKSNVKRVQVVGRRGAAQASFTIKEVRELTRLEGVTVSIEANELARGMNAASEEEAASSRGGARIMELMKSITQETSERGGVHAAEKDIAIRFLLQPDALLVDEQPLQVKIPVPLAIGKKLDLEVTPLEGSSVGAKAFELKREKTLKGISMARTVLSGEKGRQRAVASEGKEVDVLPAQLVLKSVGYKSVRLKGVPFDANRHVVPHLKGRVLEDDVALEKVDEDLSKKDGGMRQLSQTLRGLLGEEASNTAAREDIPADAPAGKGATERGPEGGGESAPLYVVGWLKRGPSGTIASSVTDAKETAASILADISEMDGGSEADPATRILALRGSTVMDWQRVKQIDSYEVAMGKRSSPPRPRVKLSDIAEMIGLKRALREQAQARKGKAASASTTE